MRSDYLLDNVRSRWLVSELARLGQSCSRETEVALVLVTHPEGKTVLVREGYPLIMDHTFIEFEPYDLAQLEAITRQRVELALAPGAIDDDCIEMVADAGLRFAQARTVVQTLRESARVASSQWAQRIAPEHVRESLTMYYDAVCESDIRELSEHERMVMAAVALLLKRRTSVGFREAYDNYAEICEDCKQAPRAKRTFYLLLRRLELERLLVLRTERIGRSDNLVIEMDVPAEEMEKQLAIVLGTPRCAGKPFST